MKIKQNNECKSPYIQCIKYYCEGKKVHLDNTKHYFHATNEIPNRWRLWKEYEKGSVVGLGVLVCFYVFLHQDQAGCLNFLKEKTHLRKTQGELFLHAPAVFELILWEPIFEFSETKMRVVGKVILICQMFKYWPKESLIQFLVQLASMA